MKIKHRHKWILLSEEDRKEGTEVFHFRYFWCNNCGAMCEELEGSPEIWFPEDAYSGRGRLILGKDNIMFKEGDKVKHGSEALYSSMW